jgi:hypothetical protein
MMGSIANVAIVGTGIDMLLPLRTSKMICEIHKAKKERMQLPHGDTHSLHNSSMICATFPAAFTNGTFLKSENHSKKIA